MVVMAAAFLLAFVGVFDYAAASDAMEILNQGAECLYAHNVLRALNNAGPLVWDNELARASEAYAEKMVIENSIAHSSGPYGENLFLGWGGTPNCPGLVYGWYNEYLKHDFSSNNFIYASGHFTQVVWNSTTKVGMGVAHSKTLNRWAACARYTPAGNVAGQFLANVFPKDSTAVLMAKNDLLAAAANVTPFVIPPNSGHALALWSRGIAFHDMPLGVLLLRALPFIASVLALLMHGR